MMTNVRMNQKAIVRNFLNMFSPKDGYAQGIRRLRKVYPFQNKVFINYFRKNLIFKH